MKTFKEPDRKAPRYREKTLTLLKTSTLNKFKEKFPKYKDLSFQDFKKIISTFNDSLAQGIMENRNGIELPNGLGNIFIGTCPKPKEKENIDFASSIKHGVKVTHKNWDSDNNLMKIFYTNHNAKYSYGNKQAWAFKASRPFRKQASNYYKENWQKYINVAPNEKISAMFDRHRVKEKMKNLKPIIPEGYDEFKL